VRAGRHHFAGDVIGSLQPKRFMPTFRALGVAAIAGVIMAGAASCANPRAEANVATALNDAANEINGLKNDVAQLQTQVDSLRTMVMQQDSLINRIAAVNNIPR
jgi:peptidoglycan hydrolase CwlO-like protein